MGFSEQVQEVAFQAQTFALQAVERLSTGLAYTPSRQNWRADPYPFYRQLQERDPFHHSISQGGWVLSRYHSIEAVLKDRRFSSDIRHWRNWPSVRKIMHRVEPKETNLSYTPSMLELDPPDHTRMRKLVSKAFTPRALEALRPRIEQIVADIVETAKHNDGMNVIEDLAYPLPVMVIAEMLGVPHEDRDQFRHWSDEAIRDIDAASLDDFRRARQAQGQLREYFAGIVEQCRNSPRDDIISALIQAEEEGDKLTTDELYATCVLILVAGHETTTNLIGNGLLALLQHPDQLHRLQEEPELMSQAVEELLRYNSPVQNTVRFATEECEFEGYKIKKGDQMVLLLGAGNRDPEVFARPDQLDITRPDIRPLSFGYGIHFCLGAALARMEASAAFSALLAQCPELQLGTEALQWRNSATFRGLVALPVIFSTQSRSDHAHAA